MKTKILSLTIGLLLIASFSVLAQELKTETFKVFGNCGMCESRIEKAVTGLEGVTKADWDKETKMVEISFDEGKVKLDDIHKAVAKVGHDTEKEKAKDEVYNALAGCCKYERKL
ncbi:MAG: heavy-metal-associated domain-containing protein [Salinivirgaceae bacterium]|jgi:mercuric ion binding protein|nr:heavy-metal-associated domain-containing protein [Salinivirgaceae bacterium]